MTPEEFERLKEEEKAHLRQLRALKGQHRNALRQKSTLDALTGMLRPDLADTHDEMVDKVMGGAIHHEARLDIALEDAAARAAAQPSEADREALRKAEADALVRQLKTEMGGGGSPSTTGPAAPRVPDAHDPAAGKTLGRVPAPDAANADPDAPGASEAKSIGRPRRAE